MPNILGMYDEGYASGRNQAGQTIIDNALANYSADRAPRPPRSCGLIRNWRPRCNRRRTASRAGR